MKLINVLKSIVAEKQRCRKATLWILDMLLVTLRIDLMQHSTGESERMDTHNKLIGVIGRQALQFDFDWLWQAVHQFFYFGFWDVFNKTVIAKTTQLHMVMEHSAGDLSMPDQALQPV